MVHKVTKLNQFLIHTVFHTYSKLARNREISLMDQGLYLAVFDRETKLSEVIMSEVIMIIHLLNSYKERNIKPGIWHSNGPLDITF